MGNDLDRMAVYDGTGVGLMKARALILLEILEI
jgi:hypothetical protein